MFNAMISDENNLIDGSPAQSYYLCAFTLDETKETES